ncbi:hypothetical protein Smp_110400.1, partial [Schistosoma mansoni]|uniref:hypothetical protein n=1 Tax=Schistosoma mansoni TaxID=6183 RepID=UPI000341B16E
FSGIVNRTFVTWCDGCRLMWSILLMLFCVIVSVSLFSGIVNRTLRRGVMVSFETIGGVVWTGYR